MASPQIDSDISCPIYRDIKMCRNEKIPTKVYNTSDEASIGAAREIIDLINKRDGKVVLGLATGSTPTVLYAELIRAYKSKEVSFKNVITFNLDEYYPMKSTQFQSYRLFMNEILFNHIDIDMKNVHIPDGSIPLEQVDEFCYQYEKDIENAGGIDIQILGIGRSGHIGFNEPGSPINSTTRKIYLDHITRLDASSDFFSLNNVPTQAITMGVGTIMKAKRILLLCFSEGKAQIISKAIEGPSTELVVASLLQQHPNTHAFLDLPAAAELTYYVQPWTLTLKDSTLKINYDKSLIKKAVIWLSKKCKKPILSLQENDYYEHHLNILLEQCGCAESINLFVFQSIQDTISGWPSGKINKTTERSLKIYQHPTLNNKSLYNSENAIHKKIIIFSPHPDDDVISMGGTLMRLCEQGNDVHTVYQTNGSIAVWDDDVLVMTNFASKYLKLIGIGTEIINEKIQSYNNYFKEKTCLNGFQDNQEILEIKKIIRETEAIDAAIHAGVKKENIHFLDLPFYQTGKVTKKPITQDDIDIIKNLLVKIQPEIIFAAGDLTDPHGTHRKCTRAVLTAINQLKNEGIKWVNDLIIYLYRGAWQEWEIDRVDLIVPMSPQEVISKRLVIFKHKSQKDLALFPGTDSREFWQRAEQRNKNTAETLSNLGFANFAAAEAFVKYNETILL